MKITEMATLQFCSELDKVWPEMHACWPWQNAIDRSVSTAAHGRPQKFFQGGNVDILLIFFRLLAMQRKWTYTKKKMFNVTATLAYSVFIVRKLYNEQMFVSASMDFLRLS